MATLPLPATLTSNGSYLFSHSFAGFRCFAARLATFPAALQQTQRLLKFPANWVLAFTADVCTTSASRINIKSTLNFC